MKNKLTLNQKIKKPKKIIICVVITLFLVLTGIFAYKKLIADCCLPPTLLVENNNASNTYFSDNLSLMLKLPPKFEASETRNKPFYILTITNNLKVKYSSLKPETQEINNYQLTVTVKSDSYDEISQGIQIDKTITLGPNTFQTGFIGAEDEGERYYFLKTSTGDWLIATQSVRDESRIPETDKTKDGYLNNDQQQNYTEQILSGLGFI